MKKILLLTSLLIISVMLGCNKNTQTQKTETKSITKVIYLTAGPDSTAELVADSIIYTVYLKNPDSLDEWRTYTLRYLNHDKLVNLIFESIYNGQSTAYSYRDWIYGQKVKIPIDSVRSLEFLKNRIGQIEFVERWFYSPQTNTFYKQVLEATLAYELYDNQGEVRGYAPLFKVIFNEDKKQNIAK